MPLPGASGCPLNSVRYIQAAHNFTSGAGLSTWDEAGFQPLTHFPPLYPLILAIAASSLQLAAAWAHSLQALLFAANIASLGLIAWYYSPGKRWLGIIAAITACLALPLLEIHAWAWSEPLFLLLATWALFALYRHLEKPENLWLLCAAGLAALACLARYLGFAVVLAGVLAILLLSRKPLKSRLVDLLVFSAISLLPVSIWLVSGALLGSASAERMLAYHPLSLAQIKTIILVMTTWLAPLSLSNRARLWLAILLAVSSLSVAILLYKRRGLAPRWRQLAFLSIITGSYLLALAVSLSVFDASTPLDNRILSPLFAAFLLLVICLLGAALEHNRLPGRVVLIVCFIWMAATYSIQAAHFLKGWRQQGLGYSSPRWIYSETLTGLRGLASQGPIYSNFPDAITFFTGHAAYSLPLEFNPFTLTVNPQLAAEIQRMGDTIKEE